MKELEKNKILAGIITEGKKDESFEPEYYSVKDRMDYYKERKNVQSDLPEDILKRVKEKHVGKIFDLDVWVVDGEILRNESDIDFCVGGNPARYIYVPAGEAWIEKTFTYTDFVATLMHEFTEYIFMKFKGLSYDNAHDHANVAEGGFRKKVAKGKIKIGTYEDALKLAVKEIEAHFKNKTNVNLEKVLSTEL